MQNNKFKVPFYFSPVLIAILTVLWPLYGVPLIAAIILLVMRTKQFTMVPKSELGKLSVLNSYDEQVTSYTEKIKNAQDKITNLQTIYEEKKAEKENMLTSECKSLQNEISELKKQLKNAQNDVDSFYSVPENLSTELETMHSAEIKNKIVIMHQQEKALIKEKKATKLSQPAYSKKSSEQRKIISQILRGFRSEVNSLISKLTAFNIDSIRNRMTRTFNSYNSLFKNEGVSISKEYFELKLNELTCWYEYERKLADEKELLRAQKEQIREEEKVRREIEREKRKIEKDEKQFNNEIARLMKYMQVSTVEAEKNLYIDKIKDLETKLASLEEAKKTVTHRKENAKAGFVYIISNIGSFGENVYKIGMTRRLEPKDRIRELSSASVPFPFDVHAMIFAEDAPALEALLHQYFRSHEVNKVNHRKEFFKVSLADIEVIVKKNFNDTVTFVDIPPAEEYRETMRLNKAAI